MIIGINRTQTETINDLRRALDAKPSAIALNIVRDGANFYVLIQ